MAQQPIKPPKPPFVVQIKDEHDITKWISDAFPKGQKQTAHVHFLDGESSDSSRLNSILGVPNVESFEQSHNIAEKLKRDIISLCLFTEGVYFTYSGNENGVVFKALNRLWKHDNFKDYQTQRSIVAAIPPGGSYEEEKDANNGDRRPYHHVLCNEFEDHHDFCCRMMNKKRNCEHREETTVVCVLVNGGKGALRAAVSAMENGIPVIVMKGTGGYADLLAHTHDQAEEQTIRQRDSENKVRTVTVKVVDCDTKSIIEEELRASGDKESLELLDKLLDNINLVTVYNPAGSSKSGHTTKSSIGEESDDDDFDFGEMWDTMSNYEELSDNWDDDSEVHFEEEEIDNEDIEREDEEKEDNEDVFNHMFPDMHKEPGETEEAEEDDSEVHFEEEEIDNEDIEREDEENEEDNEDVFNHMFPDMHKEPEETEEAEEDSKFKCLDAVILEALLKYKQEKQIRHLLGVMQKTHRHIDDLGQGRSASFIEDEKLQLTHFIQALVNYTPYAVSAFLDHLDLKFRGFHFRWILRLYSVRPSYVQEKKKPSATEQFANARQSFKDNIGNLPFFPLHCPGKDCKTCSNCISTESKSPKGLQTCLHPVHELFLWALWSRQADLALALWAWCDDKMAAALFARAFMNGAAKKTIDIVSQKELQDYANRFQHLAVETLRACYEMDDKETQQLITKPCPWWGGLSVMQIAILTANRAFVAEDACRKQLNDIWKGSSPGLLVTDKRNEKFNSRPLHLRPEYNYWMSMVWQFLFLLLFSYVLLFDFGHTATPWFIVLCAWVLDTAAEEIRQMLKISSQLHVFESRPSPLVALKRYWSESWNYFDLVTIFFFVLGLLVLVDEPVLQDLGRAILSLDVFLFFLRFMQMFLFFHELGGLLEMAKRMVMDTVWFMIILVTIMLGFAVATEAMMYPQSDLSGHRLYLIPTKAWWQLFGELYLDELQGKECRDDGRCPTSYGQYLIPILLGVYMMFTNVLLLNLLIAKFGVTFGKIQQEVAQHQRWQRCETVLEFCTRSPFPPPLNLLRCLYNIVREGAMLACRSSCCHHVGAVSGGSSEEDKLSLKTSLCGKRVTVEFEGKGSPGDDATNSSKAQKFEKLRVEVRDGNDISCEIGKCIMATKSDKNGHRKGQLTIWKDDPLTMVRVSLVRDVKHTPEQKPTSIFVGTGAKEALMYSEQVSRMRYFYLQQFESREAAAAQYNVDNNPSDPQAREKKSLEELYYKLDHVTKERIQNVEESVTQQQQYLREATEQLKQFITLAIQQQSQRDTANEHQSSTISKLEQHAEGGDRQKPEAGLFAEHSGQTNGENSPHDNNYKNGNGNNLGNAPATIADGATGTTSVNSSERRAGKSPENKGSKIDMTTEESVAEFLSKWFPDLENKAYSLPRDQLQKHETASREVAGNKVHVIRSRDQLPKDFTTRSTIRDGRTQKRILDTFRRLITNSQSTDTTHADDTDHSAEATSESCFGCAGAKVHPETATKTSTKKEKDVFVAITQVRNGLFGDRPVYAAVTGDDAISHNKLKQGNFDVLVVHKKYGLLLGYVKPATTADPDNLKKSLEDAIEFLKMSQKTVAEFLGEDKRCPAGAPRVKTMLMLPNVPRQYLKDMLAKEEDIRQKLAKCLGVESAECAEIVCQCCLCEDDVDDDTKLYERWRQCLREKEGEDEAMQDPDVYKDLVAKFSVSVTAVQVYLSNQPRLHVWGLDHAVSAVGEEYGRELTCLSLFPQQLEVLEEVHDEQDEDEVKFLCGPPGTAKTILLLLKGIKWLNDDCGAVFIVQSDGAGAAATYLVAHQLKKSVPAKADNVKVITMGQVWNDGACHWTDIGWEEICSVVREIRQHTGGESTGKAQTVHILADEANSEVMLELCSQLRSHYKVKMWAAGVDLSVPKHLQRKLNVKIRFLTEPLRCPPSVVREVQQADDMKFGDVPDYSRPDCEPVYDGLDIIHIPHYGLRYQEDREGHACEGYDAPWRCKKCGEEVAKTLTETLGIGKGGSGLTYNDVFILGSGIDCRTRITREDEMSPDPFIDGLKAMNTPTRKVGNDDREGIRRLAERSWDDEDQGNPTDAVTVVRELEIWGLERKVIVYLDHGDRHPDFVLSADQAGRLKSFSRATSQLVWVKPVNRDSDTTIYDLGKKRPNP